MNFYKHHIGDYAQATAHLSFVEDAAYSRLLRKYYAEEKPLPVEVKAVQRLVGARTPEEREAVETVLSEFFLLADDGWHNKRADEEIARAQAQAETNRLIAEQREARKRERVAHGSSTNRGQGQHESLNESSASREPSHKPLATSQREDQKLPTTSGAVAPTESKPADPIFGHGLAFLVRKAIPEKQARSFLGLMRKELRDDMTVAALLAEAEVEDITKPVEWLTKAVQVRKSGAPPRASPPSSAAARVAENIRKAAEAGKFDEQKSTCLSLPQF